MSEEAKVRAMEAGRVAQVVKDWFTKYFEARNTKIGTAMLRVDKPDDALALCIAFQCLRDMQNEIENLIKEGTRAAQDIFEEETATNTGE